MYCQRLKAKDFTVTAESLSRKRVGEREYLNDVLTKDLKRVLNHYFEKVIEIPRIRAGKKQTIETLINEETLMIAQFLRAE